jgi:hypothetical protein
MAAGQVIWTSQAIDRRRLIDLLPATPSPARKAAVTEYRDTRWCMR